MSGVGTGIALAAGLGVAGSVGGAAIASSGASKAATTQANAADTAAQLQAQEAQNALNFQEQEFSTQQQNLAPWLSAGKGALGNLSELTSTPGQGLLTPWTQTFNAPTLAQAEQYPGYQFQEQQGQEALQNSAASQGNLLSGNTLEALSRYGQNFAQSDYTNVYNQALQQYLNSYNIFQNNQANEYNRLAGISGTGQNTATTLGSEGQAAAQNEGNISLTTGAQQGQDIQNAAAAEASGYVGGANAWSGALGGSSGNLLSYALMNQYLNPATPGGYGAGANNPSPYTNPDGSIPAV
jgi:hypothetical protein